jgi:UDP-3-O-[3-hydroxymyristoyl] glucosamine N-acyltransferase
MKASDLKNLNSDVVKFITGNPDAEASKVLPPDTGDSSSLVFASKPEQLQMAIQNKASIIVVGFEAKGVALSSHQALFQAVKIPQAMTVILPLFDAKKARFNWGSDIHPKAYLDLSAEIGPNVKIGPGAFIGANVKIGAGTVIGANTVIENDCSLGENCILHPLVFIGANTIMGNRCEIHPNTSLGSDGFGYAPDKHKVNKKIPQLGRVILGDDVEIGSGCAIDRATLTETRIRSGTKFDNLIHIAHNCDIGEHSLIAGGFMMAGSSKTGSHFMTGGNTVVADHINIADNVVLAGRSTVTNDVTESGAYGGYPLQPLREALKTIANIGQLTKMRKQMSAIMKKLNLTDDDL